MGLVMMGGPKESKKMKEEKDLMLQNPGLPDSFSGCSRDVLDFTFMFQKAEMN